MSEEPPHFYLASSEGYDLTEPRRCWRIKRLATNTRSDLLLVRIEPPLVGQKYGLGGRDIDLVVVATRHQGDSLFPVKEWPVFVHVARPLIENPQDHDRLRDEEFESIAWAELYPSEEDARIKAM
jgi:hypothetical protein